MTQSASPKSGDDIAPNPETTSGDSAPYHKGQVAERLLEEARRILKTELVEDITARRLCRAVGVTSGNFYNHYPNLEYLLLEIAAQEFDRGVRENAKILRRNLGRDASLILVAQSAVEFSIKNQQFFRIMYGHISDTSINPRYLNASDAAMRVLVQTVYGDDRYDPQNLTQSHENCTQAYAFVAFLSGLGSTFSQGIFANPSGTTAERKRFTTALTQIFIDGLGPQDGTPSAA